MSCNKCNQDKCCCTDPSRYNGVDIECLDINTGEVYDSVVEKMANEICSLVENYSGIIYVDHVSFTSSTGTPSNVPNQPGETDTYTLWLNAAETESVGSFTVYNGANGTDGQDIDHVSFTSSSLGGAAGQPGATDTYTVWGNVLETINLGTFIVYNGTDGTDEGGILFVNMTRYEAGDADIEYDVDTSLLTQDGDTIVIDHLLEAFSTSAGNYQFINQGGNPGTSEVLVLHTFSGASDTDVYVRTTLVKQGSNLEGHCRLSGLPDTLTVYKFTCTNFFGAATSKFVFTNSGVVGDSAIEDIVINYIPFYP